MCRGNTPATTCATPTPTTTAQVTVSRAGSFATWRSTAKITSPPTINATAMGVTVSGSSAPSARAVRPSTAVMQNATKSFSV